METSIVSFAWTLVGFTILAVIGVRIAMWLVRKIMPPTSDQAPQSVNPRAPGTMTALDQRREYLESCGRRGECAVFGCGAGATEKMPSIVQTIGLGNGFVRWLGHKPQDRYHVSTDLGTHNLLCGGHATIAVSIAELELAQRNASYAEHCRDQAGRIVEFGLVHLLDALSADMAAATKKVQQRPASAMPKLAAVQPIQTAANGSE
jgi:hypothetical protein